MLPCVVFSPDDTCSIGTGHLFLLLGEQHLRIQRLVMLFCIRRSLDLGCLSGPYFASALGCVSLLLSLPLAHLAEQPVDFWPDDNPVPNNNWTGHLANVRGSLHPLPQIHAVVCGASSSCSSLCSPAPTRRMISGCTLDARHGQFPGMIKYIARSIRPCPFPTQNPDDLDIASPLPLTGYWKPNWNPNGIAIGRFSAWSVTAPPRI